MNAASAESCGRLLNSACGLGERLGVDHTCGETNTSTNNRPVGFTAIFRDHNRLGERRMAHVSSRVTARAAEVVGDVS